MTAPPESIPIVGEPVAWGIGLVVLVLVVFARTWAGALVTVAHEGGHMVLAALCGRGPFGFHVNETTGGGGTLVTAGWSVGAILGLMAGYPTPPLVGLAGAVALSKGLTWPVLIAAVVLLVAALFQAEGLFTVLVVALAGAGVGWAALAGNATVQAAVAVALVWLMLIGSLGSLVNLGTGGGESDAARLQQYTLIPRLVWVAAFWAVALVCLWLGARRLLVF